MDRPRERLRRDGAPSLGDAELVALVLGTGARARSALALGDAILRASGGLAGLGRTNIATLTSIGGLGPAKAAQVLAAVELGRRVVSLPLHRASPLRSSAEVARALGPRFRGLEREEFWAVALDARHRPMGELRVAVGGLTGCALGPAEVFRALLRDGAAATVLAHNHPSGDPTPSPEDRALTDRLARAGELLGVAVLDHVILGETTHFSFLDAGWLPPRGMHAGRVGAPA